MRLLLAILLLGGSLGFALPAHAAGDGHGPSFDEINWYYGMLGEREGVEPGVVWRPVGMPAPFGALLLNTAIFYYILYRLFRKPVQEGLTRRKQTLLRGMEEAARMKQEAEEQLAGYELKLASVDQEVLRVQRDVRSAGETERKRILAEARERRARMERDAQLLVEQELKATHERLVQETVEGALRSAARTLQEKLGEAEQQRFAEAYLADLVKSAPVLRGRL